MIDQNQLIQYGHPSEVRDFQALSHDKLYLDRFNNIQQYSDYIVKNDAMLQRYVPMLKGYRDTSCSTNVINHHHQRTLASDTKANP